MTADLTRRLEDWLAGGGRRIGQVVIEQGAEGWELRHHEDEGRGDLVVYRAVEAAREVSKFDAKAGYRPLKTARNLAGGWLLILTDVAAVRRALDYLYPAMLGIAESQERGELPVVTLRETLARQTGMYRVTQKVSDGQARETIDRFCAGCLKQRLWEIDARNPQAPVFAADEWPLLCHEACNLLVAEVRRVVKKTELSPGQTHA